MILPRLFNKGILRTIKVESDKLVLEGTQGNAEFAGGGGGTDDYADLENKPQINGVTLSGDKSTSDIIPTGDGLVVTPDGDLVVAVNVDKGLTVNQNGELEASIGAGLAFDENGNIANTVQALPSTEYAGENYMVSLDAQKNPQWIPGFSNPAFSVAGHVLTLDWQRKPMWSTPQVPSDSMSGTETPTGTYNLSSPSGFQFQQIYQKTIVDTMPTSGNSKYISIGANIRYGEFEAYVLNASGVIQKIPSFKFTGGGTGTLDWSLRGSIFTNSNSSNPNTVFLESVGNSTAYDNQTVIITVRYIKA